MNFSRLSHTSVRFSELGIFPDFSGFPRRSLLRRFQYYFGVVIPEWVFMSLEIPVRLSRERSQVLAGY